VAKLKNRLSKPHVVFHSTTPENDRKCGVAIVVKKELFDLAVQHKFEVFKPGRVINLTLQFEGSSLSIDNVHNFELTCSEINAFINKALTRNSYAANDPRGSSMYVLLGDFNFREKGEKVERVCPPKGIDMVSHTDHRENENERERRKWAPLLDKMTEHHQPEHTRQGHHTQGDLKGKR